VAGGREQTFSEHDRTIVDFRAELRIDFDRKAVDLQQIAAHLF